jgi:Tol biopolymer transport system component
MTPWRRLLAWSAAAAAIAGMADAEAQAVRPVAFLPEVLRSAEHDSLALSPDGNELFLTRSRADFGASRLLVLRRQGEGWTAPRPRPFSDGTRRDAGGSLSADGRRLYFTSGRPTGLPEASDDWNVFVAERGASGWPEKVAALPAPINSPRSECCVVAAADGSLLFSSERDGSWDIFRARPDGATWRIEKLPEGVNTRHMEWPAWISRDGSLLLFSSIRPGGAGGDDLYVSRLAAGGFGPPVNLGPPVNTPGYEDGPSLSADGRTLFYSTRPPDGNSDVHTIPWSAVDPAGRAGSAP